MKENALTLPMIFLVVFILLLQSVYLFMDARKRNYNYWFWGIIGLIQAPMPTIFYLLFIRKVFNKKEADPKGR